MSDNHPDHPPSGPRYQSADEIVRSILDDRASTSSEISPSGELYRAIERFHANAHRRTGLVNSARRDLVRSHLNRWASASTSASTSGATTRTASRTSMSSDANDGSNSHRRSSRDTQQSTSGTPSLPPLRSITYSARRSGVAPRQRSAAAPAGFSPVSSQPGGPGGRNGRWRADQYPERYRPSASSFANRASNRAAESATHTMISDQGQQPRRLRLGQTEADVQQLNDLDDANNQLRALLDFTPPPTHAYSELSFPSPPLQVQESTDDNRRIKRRKLDSDHPVSGYKGFRYGKYGQVEPGPLTMEIVSCDGGIYSDDGHSYAAENILKNDVSVYCTKGPRCNIVLRHQGSTAFTLKELVIKAPRQNYTSPVREGMVFISMNSDSLLARTAQYRIPYIPIRSSLRRAERDTLAPIVSIRHNEDGTTMTRAQIRARRLYNIGLEDANDNGYRSAQIPSDFTTSPPPFHVTTICSDDEDDSNMRPYWRAPPNRIGSLPFESDGSSGDELGLYHEYAHRRRRFRTPLQGAGEDAAASQEGLRGYASPGEGDLMAAHARFFIEPDKSKCTIRFDPPVSGRFILLKMWSPHPESTSNIDIQAVIANGFAGPRYFPAVELR